MPLGAYRLNSGYWCDFGLQTQCPVRLSGIFWYRRSFIRKETRLLKTQKIAV